MEALEAELSKASDANAELSAELRQRDYGGAEGLQPLVRDLEAQVATLREAERRALEKVKLMEEQMKNLKNLEEVRLFSLCGMPSTLESTSFVAVVPCRS